MNIMIFIFGTVQNYHFMTFNTFTECECFCDIKIYFIPLMAKLHFQQHFFACNFGGKRDTLFIFRI